MKYFLLFGLMSVAIFSLGQNKPLVVVELFTSEGCSSCPAADRLLSKVLKEASDDSEIIGLSYHVDYWNYIGWKDPYSDARFTQRQRAYARRLRSSVYTPQMVINGRREIVGSSEVQWAHAHAEEVKANHVKPIGLLSAQLEEEKLLIEPDVPKQAKRLLVVIVERALSQSVNRGENRGRTLAHDNVVRVLKVIDKPKDVTSLEIVLPDDLNIENSKVVVYSQDPMTLEVNHASQFDLVDFRSDG